MSRSVRICSVTPSCSAVTEVGRCPSRTTSRISGISRRAVRRQAAASLIWQRSTQGAPRSTCTSSWASVQRASTSSSDVSTVIVGGTVAKSVVPQSGRMAARWTISPLCVASCQGSYRIVYLSPDGRHYALDDDRAYRLVSAAWFVYLVTDGTRPVSLREQWMLPMLRDGDPARSPGHRVARRRDPARSVWPPGRPAHRSTRRQPGGSRRHGWKMRRRARQSTAPMACASVLGVSIKKSSGG